jgi:hypothetical protein
MKFTVEQFRKYLEKSASFGDALYFLSEESILKANEEDLELEIDLDA